MIVLLDVADAERDLHFGEERRGDSPIAVVGADVEGEAISAWRDRTVGERIDSPVAVRRAATERRPLARLPNLEKDSQPLGRLSARDVEHMLVIIDQSSVLLQKFGQPQLRDFPLLFRGDTQFSRGSFISRRAIRSRIYGRAFSGRADDENVSEADFVFAIHLGEPRPDHFRARATPRCSSSDQTRSLPVSLAPLAPPAPALPAATAVPDSPISGARQMPRASPPDRAIARRRRPAPSSHPRSQMAWRPPSGAPTASRRSSAAARRRRRPRRARSGHGASYHGSNRGALFWPPVDAKPSNAAVGENVEAHVCHVTDGVQRLDGCRACGCSGVRVISSRHG